MKSDRCFYCEHYYWNNADTYKDGYRGGWCRAYPDDNGCPYNYPKDGHEEIQDNQVGDFVFKQCKPEMIDIVERDFSISEQRGKEMREGLY